MLNGIVWLQQAPHCPPVQGSVGSGSRTSFEKSWAECGTLPFHLNGTIVPRHFHSSSKAWNLLNRKKIIQQRIFFAAPLAVKFQSAAGLVKTAQMGTASPTMKHPRAPKSPRKT
jgi:hypothetical protein